MVHSNFLLYGKMLIFLFASFVDNYYCKLIEKKKERYNITVISVKVLRIHSPLKYLYYTSIFKKKNRIHWTEKIKMVNNNCNIKKNFKSTRSNLCCKKKKNSDTDKQSTIKV